MHPVVAASKQSFRRTLCRAPRRGTGYTAPSSLPRGFSARGQYNSLHRRPFAAASGVFPALAPRRIARTRPSACAR